MDSMHPFHRIRNALAVIALISGIPAVASATPDTSSSARCSAVDYRQFDFWIGD